MIKSFSVVFVIGLLSCSDALSASSPESRSDAAPAPKRSFLADITAATTDTEHQFFERLLKEGGHEDLLEKLRVITSADAQTSRIGTPDGGSRPVTDADLTWPWVKHQTKRLTWHAVVGEGDHSRRVLIFYPQITMWPGSQPIEIVLTDPEFRVLSWVTAGGEPQFASAEILSDAGTQRLLIRFRLRGVGPLFATIQFDVGATELVSKRGMPPLPGLENWVLPRWVTIRGAVKVPGKYAVRSKQTVKETLEEAGWKTDSTNHEVHLVRKETQMLLNMAKQEEAETVLESNDTIEAMK